MNQCQCKTPMIKYDYVLGPTCQTCGRLERLKSPLANNKHSLPAMDALLAYQRADEGGIMVLVSRQAIHEVASHHSELVDELTELVEAVKFEVNENGGSGFLLARLTDSRALLSKLKASGGVG